MQPQALTGIFALKTEAVTPSRRGFLKLGAGSGAGLVLGLAVPVSGAMPAAAAGEATLAPNPFVKIAPDNTVTVVIKHLDKGQGAATGLATLVAEELDADWAQIRTEFAVADAVKYKNFAFGVQGVGGSTGLSNSWTQYRQAGATARAMLVAAAAKAWGVPQSEVSVVKGVLTHSSGKTATFGDLAAKAAELSVPGDVKLKAADQFTYIGKSFPRVDSKAKTNGSAVYTLDVRMPDMLTAVIARPPKFGAKVASFDASKAEQIAGVVKVVQIPQGVAILAKSTWPALKARDALAVTWDDSGAEQRGTDALIAEYTALLDKPGVSARKDGDAEAELAKAAKVISVDYVFPFLAHAPMEPLDCVIKTDGSTADIWTGSQLQTVDHATACKILGLKPEAINLHTLWAGGSFGRRAIADAHFVAEACEIAKAYGQPVPIKVMWTREDDIKGGWYRPIYVHRLRAGLDDKGNVVAWHHRIAGQSILDGTPFAATMVKDGIDQTSVEGASNLPYAIPNLAVELHTTKSGVPVLWWRSVGSTHTAHATEHMIDLIAKETGKDPYELRLSLLKDKPRHVGALKLAAEKAGWGTPLAAGRYRGIAVHESFASFVAQVAEIAMKDDGGFKVERVVCAIDCGIAVNPDVVAAQVEGGIGYGLGAALRDAITMTDGVVDQSNFDGYEPLRISDMPHVEVHIVPSAADPTGVGEPGVPPTLPAVANALLSATGVVTKILPMSKQSYKSV